MDIVRTVIYYLLLLLIRLGDGVLFVITLILSCLLGIGKITQSIVFFIKNVIIKFIRFIGKFLLLIKKSTQRVFTPKKKSHAKKMQQKNISYPTKQTGGKMKFRYFFYGTFFSLLFFFLPIAVFLFLQELPSPEALTTRQIPQTTKIYDKHGVLLTQIYGPQDRTIVTLGDIPDHLKKATIAIEDKNFYTHNGFDLQAIARALRENISGRSFQGASTITQQLVRSSFLTNDPNILRKVKEIVIAFWTERIYTKDEILEMYLNQIPYGGTAWGAEAAAEVYFGKHVRDLDLAESAFLAGITTAPSIYSPYGQEPNKWKIRQKEVLSQMVRLGFISDAKRNEALSEKLTFRRGSVAIHAPHFVNYVKDYLVDKYGIAMVERGGLTVKTSLDLTTQNQAETIVSEEVSSAAYLNLTNGALLVTTPSNGDVLAMVGSRDFNDPNGGNVNVTTRERQPGSSIKPVTYAAALTKGYTAASILDDTQTTYTSPGGPSYSPVNYDGKFRGRVPFRLALANSLNIPAVKILNQIGVPAMVDLAKKMGITTWGNAEEYGLSITLGAAEVKMTDMATVFGTFANDGRKVTLNPILKITDYKGDIIEEKGDPNPKQVLPAAVAYIISDILSDNQARSMEFGSNSPLHIPGHTVSVKTGTTDNKRDNWTIGYTTNVLTAVWVGNNDNQPMSQSLASGITGAAPIWNKMMTYLLKKTPETPRIVPDEITSKPCFGRIEYFVRGTENVSCPGRFVTPTTSERRQ